ncbi:MAG: hypothetical protein IJ368_05045 [Oscillospiraceae bacterium]|nr:hypothetical protein [Oscillospiraceae bacterium]
MEIYGSKKINTDGQLKEAVLNVTAKELDSLIAFLSEIRDEAPSPEAADEHYHLRDHYDDWNTSMSDLIIYVSP